MGLLVPLNGVAANVPPPDARRFRLGRAAAPRLEQMDHGGTRDDRRQQVYHWHGQKKRGNRAKGKKTAAIGFSQRPGVLRAEAAQRHQLEIFPTQKIPVRGIEDKRENRRNQQEREQHQVDGDKHREKPQRR